MSSTSKEVVPTAEQLQLVAEGRACKGCYKKLRKTTFGLATDRYCIPCRKAGRQHLKTKDRGGRREQPFWDWYDVDVLQMVPLEASVDEGV